MIAKKGDMVLLKDGTTGKVLDDITIMAQDENGNKFTVEITEENPIAEIF